MNVIDLCFPILGQRAPADHGYALYAAISSLLPTVHNDALVLGIAPIAGQSIGDGLIQLTERSRLRLRMPAERIAEALPLSGKPLDLAGHRVRLGVPSVYQLTPAATLAARLVTIKLADRSTEHEAFLAAVRRKLDALGVQGEITIPTVLAGPHAGRLRRRIIRIKDKRIVGYSLIVEGLNADESLCLQEQPAPATAFGRRKLGCAFFMPLRPRST